jgi:aspartate/methionine/tyrosine aminotransferase
MTGFRLGYLMAKDATLIKRMNTIHQNLATCAPAMSQYLALGFSNILSKVGEFRDYYKENRDMIVELFPELEIYKPDGGFYYFIDMKPFGIKDAGAFCKYLLEAHVATVPGDAYGTGYESCLRLSFSVEREMLKEGILRFKNAINTFKK